MLYRTMPRSTERLSILGYGCMRFPEKGGKIDEVQAEKQMRRAIEQGVNYYDTAMPYHMGASEPFLGKVLSKDGLRNKVFLATKLPPWSVHSRADMDRLLDIQLKNLQTDHIDYYLIHNLTGHTWQHMRSQGVLHFLEQAKQDGRIRFAGFSFHGDKNVFPEIVDAWNWDFCQIQYNFLDEQTQAGTAGLEYAAKKGLGIIIMEPLRGGNLATRIPDEVQKTWDAAPTRRTPVEWALRWIWNRPEVTLVLSGMNQDEHVEENLRIASAALPKSLTDAELQTVSTVARTYRRLMQVGCTGCQYCLPCPAGVNIPACFEVFNAHTLFKDKQASMMYMIRLGGLLGKPAKASQCSSCGACVKKCPQSLPIPQLLKQVASTFEGRGMKLKLWVFRFFLKAKRLWDLLRHRPSTPPRN